MNDKLDKRLDDLRAEYEAGQKMLAELDAKRVSVTQTLLRIEGAIAVLQELRAAESEPVGEAPPIS